MKKGQLELSFGMIFSIIIIIATVAVAIYFLLQFLNTSSCAEVGLFKSDLQSAIDDVWKSAMSKKTFTISLPKSITEICIGSLNAPHVSTYSTEYLALRRFNSFNANLFILPVDEACNGNYAQSNLNHLDTSNFVCVKLKSGKGSIILSKDSTSQTLVKISGA